MVARSRSGALRSYPVVETLHRDSICHTTEAPALIPTAVERRALQVAEKAVGCLEGEQSRAKPLLSFPGR